MHFNQSAFGKDTGPGIGGGGNTTEDGRPVASHGQIIKDPRKEPLLKGGWDYVDRFEQMVDASTTRSDLKELLKYARLKKTWYLFDVPFKSLPNERVGTTAKMKQPIYQLGREIHISKPLLRKMLAKQGLPALRELLFREHIEALMILSRNSPFEQCKGYAPREDYCDGISKVPRGSLELGAEEHSKVRTISNQILDLLRNAQPSAVFINDVITSFIRNDLLIDDSWFYGFLMEAPINIDVLENWYQAAMQAQQARQHHPEFAKCLEGLRLYSPSENNQGTADQLILELPYEGQYYKAYLPTPSCRPDPKRNGSCHGDGTPSRDASGKLLYWARPQHGGEEFSRLYYGILVWPGRPGKPKVGDIRASASLLFEKFGEDVLPLGIEYSLDLVTQVKDEKNGGWSSSGTELSSSQCHF